MNVDARFKLTYDPHKLIIQICLSLIEACIIIKDENVSFLQKLALYENP